MDKLGRYLQIALTVLAILLSVYLLGQLRSFFHDIWVVIRAVIFPFLTAMIVSYILQPIVSALVKRKVPRGIAILLIYIIFAVLLTISLIHAVPIVTRQTTQLIDNLPVMVQKANSWIDLVVRQKQYLPDTVRVGLETALTGIEQRLTGAFASIFSLVSGMVSAVITAFVVPFLVFYMLKDAKAIGRGVIKLFPHEKRDNIRELLTGVDETLGKYIRGQLLVMLAVGILTYAGYLIVGMPYALVLALFLAIADIVPYLGPFIGATPALLLALPLGWALVIKVLIVNVIVQQCEGNLISPQIMGRTLSLHPMAIVAALLLGGELGGVLGLIAAVPILAVGKVVWVQLRDRTTDEKA